MDVLNIYALGSVMAGKHLFFDTLNIKFREQDGFTKFYTQDYSYKGKEYKYMLYLVAGSFNDPALLPTERKYCDCVIFLINPLLTGVYFKVDEAIAQVSMAHPDALIVLIMQNIFENLENLNPMQQEVAISNGAVCMDLEDKYNLKLCSLNYSLNDLTSLESGDPMASFKFFKIFNDIFYDIIHEIIERNEHPEKKLLIIDQLVDRPDWDNIFEI